MSSSESSQAEFDFEAGRGEQGYNAWLEQRRSAMAELSRSLGLPLGRQVEVWLRGGVRLRGILRLKEEQLFVDPERNHKLQLLIDGVPFTPADIESCVRIE